MKRSIQSSLGALLVLLSASWAFAQTAKTVRVVLPQQADAVVRNIASVLARQVAQRCDAGVVTDGEAPLKVDLVIEPGIGMEGFRIEDRPGGGVKIVGNDARGLLYGVRKLLRTGRYDRGGFTLGACRRIANHSIHARIVRSPVSQLAPSIGVPEILRQMAPSDAPVEGPRLSPVPDCPPRPFLGTIWARRKTCARLGWFVGMSENTYE